MYSHCNVYCIAHEQWKAIKQMYFTDGKLRSCLGTKPPTNSVNSKEFIIHMSADINLLFLSVLLQSKSRNKNTTCFTSAKKTKYIENNWKNSKNLKFWFVVTEKEVNPRIRLAWEKWMMSIFDAYWKMLSIRERVPLSVKNKRNSIRFCSLKTIKIFQGLMNFKKASRLVLFTTSSFTSYYI